MDCGTGYDIGQYIDEIDEELWERISRRDCSRA
jgi:hypothetical protein